MVICALPMVAAKIYDVLSKGEYSLLRSIFIAQDYLVNSLAGGHHDTTISSQLGQLKLLGSRTGTVMADFVDWLFYIADGQLEHCINAMQEDDVYLFKPFIAIVGLSLYTANIYAIYYLVRI
jgi:hypothetical protein